MTKKPHAALNYAMAERWLRADLTRLREQTGLTRNEVCRDTGISIRTLQRIENGPTPVAADNVAVLCQYYGATREHEKELQRLRHYSQQIGWWNNYKNVLGPAYADHCEAEQQASSIDSYALIIPGLVQTESYAQNVQVRGAVARDGEESDIYVRLRLHRQEQFLKAPKRRFRLLCDLHCLRHPFCADVVDEQLKHLQDLEDRRFLELRIAIQPGPPRDFMLFTFGDPHTRKRQRLIACSSGFVDDVHNDDVHRVTQIANHFELAWEQGVPLSEVSI